MREIKSVPRLESFKRALSFVDNPIPVINEAIIKYGPTYYTQIIGGQKIVMTIEPKIAKYVLQKNNKNFPKSKLQTDSLGKYVGVGLLTANGDYWLRQRRLIQPGFHKKKLAGLIDTMESEIVKFYDHLAIRVKQNPDIDISEAMMGLTLRIVSKALFSTGIDDDKIIDLGNTINELQKHIVKEVRLPLMNWWRRINGAMARAKNLSKKARTMLQDIIDARKNEGERYDDLLDMLLHSRYEDTGEPMNNTQILDEAIILFVAGYETTANTLAWSLYALRENAEVKEKLQKEISKDTDTNTLESLMNPSYLQQVIDETMRMFPAAWILDRVALKDDNIEGVAVNKGDLIGIYVFGTHRNPAVWPQPEVFDPERFSVINKKKHEGYAFFPFGGGPRMCIGYQFANMELRMAITEFFRRFDLPKPSGDHPDLLPLITLKPRENIRMCLVLR